VLMFPTPADHRARIEPRTGGRVGHTQVLLGIPTLLRDFLVALL
jgi:hypothetical protein